MTRAARSLALAPFVMVLGCDVKPSLTGQPCSEDEACGPTHYCQLEVAPQVCLPGVFGLPTLPNHPPLIERAVVVVSLEDPAVTGRFEARDPDGDLVRFSIADGVGALGTLDVDDDGAWTFALAAPAPTTDASATFAIEASDGKGGVGRAEALVVVVAQAPSELQRFWIGGAGAGFDDAASWLPDGAPSTNSGVIVGPLAQGPLVIDGERDVFGWVSTGAQPITLTSSTVRVGGTRILSDSPLSGGRFVASPLTGFGIEVQLGGLVPSLDLLAPARVIAPLHVDGDLLLGAIAPSDLGPLFLESALSVDGDLTQDPAGAPIVMQGGTLRVGGDLSLTGEQKSFITSGLLDVAGAVDIPEGTVGNDLLVRFSRGADDTPKRVVLPDGTRVLDAFVAPGAFVELASPLIIDGALQVSGALKIAAGITVEVDTLVLRPAFVDATGDAEPGTLTARVCLVAPRVTKPAWATCEDEEITPPVDRPDGGVVIDPPPDPGPPSACTPHPGFTNDLVVHGLVVAGAGAAPLEDRLAHAGLSFAPATVALRGGDLTLAADGAFTFAANEVAGVEGVDVIMNLGFDEVVGTQDACIDVQIVDTAGMNVMVGFLWDDPASWTLGRVPTADDRVFVPPSADVRGAGPGDAPLEAEELYVSSGAVLDTGTRAIRVSEVVLVGGELRAGVEIVGDVVVGGRISTLLCGGGGLRLVADVVLEDVTAEADCAIEIGRHRLTVHNDVVIEHALGLEMQDASGTVVLEGALTTPRLTGLLNDGELQIFGAVNVDAMDPAGAPGTILSHRTYLFSPESLTLAAITYFGWLNVGAVADDERLTITGGGHIGRLSAFRTLSVRDNDLAVDELNINALFSAVTDTPDRLEVASCFPDNDNAACPL